VIIGMSIAQQLLGLRRERSPEANPTRVESNPLRPATLAAARTTAPQHIDDLGEVGPQPEQEHEDSVRGRLVQAGAIVVRAVRGALKANVTDRAAGLAYYGFLAVPSVLIVALGITGLVVDPDRVEGLVDRLSSFAPDSAIQLLQDVLDQVAGSGGSSVSLIAVGTLFALWSATGAATALMRGLNSAYGRTDSRGKRGQRIVAVVLVFWLLLAIIVAIGIVVLGPVIADRIGDAVNASGLVGGLWSGLQWPLAIAGLTLALAGILYAGPDVAHPRWQLVLPGAVFSALLWLLLSGLFSVYVANFGSYDAAWGSLSAVIVMLTWIWLSALAILLGARVNAELERSRQLRAGIRAEQGLALPTQHEPGPGEI
jgi:membrane protein